MLLRIGSMASVPLRVDSSVRQQGAPRPPPTARSHLLGRDQHRAVLRGPRDLQFPPAAQLDADEPVHLKLPFDGSSVAALLPGRRGEHANGHHEARGEQDEDDIPRSPAFDWCSRCDSSFIPRR